VKYLEQDFCTITWAYVCGNYQAFGFGNMSGKRT